MKALALPVRQAAAKYLRHLCKQADAACIRLADPADAEALHDFRVAIRRARTWLAAYHLYLPLDKALHRRLRRLARHTNAARDAEVSIAALQALAGGLTAAQKVGLRWMLDRLEQHRQEAYADILQYIPVTWPKLSRDLTHRLRRLHAEPSPGFAHIAFELAASAEAELAQRLMAVGGLQDIRAIHQARIAAKRLRYLLEPFKTDVRGVREAIGRLATLQDAMGALHDGHVLQLRLAEALEETAILRARYLMALTLADPEHARNAIRRGHTEQLGLLVLVSLTVQQQRQRFTEVQAQYLGNHLHSFMGEVELPITRLAE